MQSASVVCKYFHVSFEKDEISDIFKVSKTVNISHEEATRTVQNKRFP